MGWGEVIFTVSQNPPWGPLSTMAQTAPWPRRASPSPRSWWTMEKAFWTVSLRLEAKTEVLGSVDHKLGVVVDEASTGGIALEALSRPDAATCSSTSDRAA